MTFSPRRKAPLHVIATDGATQLVLAITSSSGVKKGCAIAQNKAIDELYAMKLTNEAIRKCYSRKKRFRKRNYNYTCISF